MAICFKQHLPGAVCLAACLACAGMAAASPTYKSVDVPGSSATFASAINDSGVIAGDEEDANQVLHGFVRTAHGAFSLFDPPNATKTFVVAINASGTIAGHFLDASRISHCFVRRPSGAITVIDPRPKNLGCIAVSLNKSGAIAGRVTDSASGVSSFVRAPSGKITIIAPASVHQLATAISDKGTVTGTVEPATTSVPSGFVRAPDGALTTFTVPNALFGTLPLAINAAGTIAGLATVFPGGGEGGQSDVIGFVRREAGDIQTFNPDGTGTALVTGINAAGTVVGYANSRHGKGQDGYVRAPGGKVTIFDVPGAQSTNPKSINSGGAIAGVFIDGKSNFHGFLRTP